MVHFKQWRNADPWTNNEKESRSKDKVFHVASDILTCCFTCLLPEYAVLKWAVVMNAQQSRMQRWFEKCPACGTLQAGSGKSPVRPGWRQTTSHWEPCIERTGGYVLFPGALVSSFTDLVSILYIVTMIFDDMYRVYNKGKTYFTRAWDQTFLGLPFFFIIFSCGPNDSRLKRLGVNVFELAFKPIAWLLCLRMSPFAASSTKPYEWNIWYIRHWTNWLCNGHTRSWSIPSTAWGSRGMVFKEHGSSNSQHFVIR